MKHKGMIKIEHNLDIKIIEKSLPDEFEISESMNFQIEYMIEKEQLKDIIMEIIIYINGLTKNRGWKLKNNKKRTIYKIKKKKKKNMKKINE